MTLENECEHKVLKYIGEQEIPRNCESDKPIPLGNCYYCNSSRVITEKYRHVAGDVWELKVK